MKKKLSALLAGALVLGVTSVAMANESVALSDTQLDTVTAGAWWLNVYQGHTDLGPISGPYPTKKEAQQVAKNFNPNPGLHTKVVELP